MKGLPKEQGLYHPMFEHDACGIGFIANFKGNPSHSIVEQGINMLCKLEHRGGQGSDPETGDGAGIMLQIAHDYFRTECKKLGFSLPKRGQYGIGMLFMPQRKKLRTQLELIMEAIVEEEKQVLLGWRDVPINTEAIGTSGLDTMPYIRQIFIGSKGNESQEDFERVLYIIRKRTEKAAKEVLEDGESSFYAASMSSSTIVYKGMLAPDQINKFYLDLKDSTYTSALALVHSRFSTNTFPSWERAHPNRYLIHNGEINTLRGNVNWMHAREKQFTSEKFGRDIEKLHPIIDDNGSDSSMLDNALEFLTLAGRTLPHAAMMMIPEPWQHDEEMSSSKRAFYEYHSCLMEPWDGPTAISFTNGKQIGAVLDRNGLRPARYYVTKDDMIVFSSEVGVVEIEEENIVLKERLSPGKMLLVDLEQGRIIPDDELKESIASERPYEEWLKHELVSIHQLPESIREPFVEEKQLLQLQKAFGYTYEELQKNIMPMVVEGKDPIGSMGMDTPLAVLSDRPQLLFNYFKQLFAQVTNPPIDALRESVVTSALSFVGPEGNLLHPTNEECHRIRVDQPVITTSEYTKLKDNTLAKFNSAELPIHFDVEGGESNLAAALTKLFADADEAINNGASLLVLTDRFINEKRAAIPVLLAVSGLHHHLVRQGTRTKVSLIADTAEARDVHHFSMLLGYGVDLIHPYLAFASIEEMVNDGSVNFELDTAVERYVDAAVTGIIKVLSKMGISTIQSYRGAQIFEAIGIDNSVIDHFFTRTASQLGGIKLETIAKETLLRHKDAFHNSEYKDTTLEAGSELQWRHNGEHHAFNPKTIHTLQQACRSNNYELFKNFSDMANNEQTTFLRSLFDYKTNGRKSVPIEEVESVKSIFKRFKTGAMSYGSLSEEAHETLAIAMNRIGGRSNSGEGGEHPSRYTRDDNGDLRRSSIKQVASGRFGVNSEYLLNADEIQIKMAQGAKPGEGGHLPGKKVYPWVAEVRGSTPGVGLISPPPHHDIYSIEDLAQLIHDLKNANPKARISVKLVSKSGVGTIAAGVAKGLADVILISGYEGGTGASPRTSIKHTGLPWELGLAETHQTLLLNNLRDRVTLETDGKMMTGRDVVIATLLGAEEYGFATAPLVILGCVMMRACHLDTCPVGVATQNPELRKKFTGKADHIVNYMTFIAQEVREIMAELGFRTIDEMVGRADVLTTSGRKNTHWKAKDLDLMPLLYVPQVSETVGRIKQREQDHKLDHSIDKKELLKRCEVALNEQKPVDVFLPIGNTNRVTGTILGHEVTRRYGMKGLKEDTINLHFKGSAGQSLGAFIPQGISITLTGDANDHVGKGLSGGKIVVRPSERAAFVPQDNVIIGNIALYGATSGEAYILGKAGERFAVRNSGAKAVVEGVGDHGCEYMTGGRVVVLGDVGKNFAAGMSGGVAYLINNNPLLMTRRCNTEMVSLESLNDLEEMNEVHEMVRNHFLYTNSVQAKMILDHWSKVVPRIVKVIPKEYKKMLVQINENQKNGLSERDAVMAAFEMKKTKQQVNAKREPLEPAQS